MEKSDVERKLEGKPQEHILQLFARRTLLQQDTQDALAHVLYERSAPSKSYESVDAAMAASKALSAAGYASGKDSYARAATTLKGMRPSPPKPYDYTYEIQTVRVGTYGCGYEDYQEQYVDVPLYRKGEWAQYDQRLSKWQEEMKKHKVNEW